MPPQACTARLTASLPEKSPLSLRGSDTDSRAIVGATPNDGSRAQSSRQSGSSGPDVWSLRQSWSSAVRAGCIGVVGAHLRPVEAVEVDDDRLLGGAGDHDDGLDVGVRVLLAVRDVRRHEDVVAGGGLDPRLDRLVAFEVEEHERRGAGDDVDRGLRCAVVVVARTRCDAGTWVWPIQRFCAPTVLPLIASSRRMPEVWVVWPIRPAGAIRCRRRWNGSMSAGSRTPLGVRTESSDVEPAGTWIAGIRHLWLGRRVGRAAVARRWPRRG